MHDAVGPHHLGAKGEIVAESAFGELIHASPAVADNAVYTVGRLSHYLIIFVGLMIGLSSVGVDFTNFALVAGALSIGIGFGLQSIVNNFVSGIIILFERSLKVGDYVELGTGVSGVVREINVRSTRINTNENVDVIVPNSNFITSDVINWTLQIGAFNTHEEAEAARNAVDESEHQADDEARPDVDAVNGAEDDT